MLQLEWANERKSGVVVVAVGGGYGSAGCLRPREEGTPSSPLIPAGPKPHPGLRPASTTSGSRPLPNRRCGRGPWRRSRPSAWRHSTMARRPPRGRHRARA